jgi:hypothetical protein
MKVRRHLAPRAICMAAALLAAPCQAQGNIDAGKSPAQIFAGTCASCHRNARELRRPSAGFLRQHYTSGSREAAALASYLARIPTEPSATQPKRSPAGLGTNPSQAARQQPASAEQRKSAQAEPKGRRPSATLEVRPLPFPEENQPPKPPASGPPAPVLRGPIPFASTLEPFQE